MGLRLFNTLGRKLMDFVSIEPGKAGFYGCGPTVYNYAHIGNLRAYVFDDLLVRTLRYLGYRVNHVMNITDVGHLTGDDDSGEDKMLKSAAERQESVLEVARYYTEAFFKDTNSLNIEAPTVVCKATEHIAEMIELIKRIEKNGYTYSAGGNLYFDVSKFAAYGELAMLKPDELQHGARIDVDGNKKNPMDFALWFTKSKFEDQALQWDSPWGRGYPGWHIECSAMSMKYLGDSFDIHAGGIDHIAVHHTNEIAQSEAATGKRWVNYWLHNEFLVMGSSKMSKSGGGFITLNTLLEAGYEALDYRYFLLGGHYRSQLQFSYDALDSARSSRKALNDRIIALKAKVKTDARNNVVLPDIKDLSANTKSRLDAFKKALEDDLSSPRALAELWGLIKEQSIAPEEALAAAYDMDRVLGLGLIELKESSTADPELVIWIEKLIDERKTAKLEKNWAGADAIRAELKAKGVLLEDSPGGTSWRLQDNFVQS